MRATPGNEKFEQKNLRGLLDSSEVKGLLETEGVGPRGAGISCSFILFELNIVCLSYFSITMK